MSKTTQLSNGNSALLVNHKDEIIRTLSLCPCKSKRSGLVSHIFASLTPLTWEELEAMHQELEPGGRWKPTHGMARSRVAIVIPYNEPGQESAYLPAAYPSVHARAAAGVRDSCRRTNMGWGGQTAPVQSRFDEKHRLQGSHPKQSIWLRCAWCVSRRVSRSRSRSWLQLLWLPGKTQTYACRSELSQLQAASYWTDLGGVVAFRTEHFLKVNSYSKLFFGWGGEDDFFYRRCKISGLPITPPKSSHGKYKGDPHIWIKNSLEPNNVALWRKRWKDDKFCSLKYTLIARLGHLHQHWVNTEVYALSKAPPLASRRLT